MIAKKFRLQVWFEGRVQGVGFRYKAAHLAKGYDVMGFVKNLDDGRVHLSALGEPSEVKAFVADLKTCMQDFIRNTQELADESELKYKNFSIEL